jgi:hypothetical protein
MRRIFGAKKEVPPPPTLDETTDRLNSRGDKLRFVIVAELNVRLPMMMHACIKTCILTFNEDEKQ